MPVEQRKTRVTIVDGLEQTGSALISAFDHIPDLFVFVKNNRREFVACSAPFVSLMGCRSRDQIIGKRDEDFSSEYLVEHYREYDEKVLSTGESLIDLVELVRNRDGTYGWFISTKTAIRNEAGNVEGILGVTRSLTMKEPTSETLLSLSPAIERITRNFASPLSVTDLASEVMMSPSAFSRVFKKHFGVSPHKYLQQVRLLAACDLLATTSLSIGDVGARTGFYDTSHLTNEMKKSRGMSPTQFRANYQESLAYRSRRHTSPTIESGIDSAPPQLQPASPD